MKAEIGFVQGSERLQMVVAPQSPTEATLLMAFAKRMALKYSEWDGELVITESGTEQAAIDASRIEREDTDRRFAELRRATTTPVGTP